MQIIRDFAKVHQIADPELRALLQSRCEELKEFSDCLEDLVCFVIVEPNDGISSIEECPDLRNCFNVTPTGLLQFGPSFQFVLAHRRWYQAVFIHSDAGEGLDIYVSQHQATASTLVALCAAHAILA